VWRSHYLNRLSLRCGREELGPDSSRLSCDLTAAMKLLAKLPGIRSLALLGASFVCTCISSTIVRGECGDYVIVGRPLVQSDPGSMDWRSRFVLLDIYRTSDPMSHSGRPPCHGLSCQSREPIPAAPSAVAPVSVPHWACLGPSNTSSPPGSSRFVHTETSPLHAGHADPIYHPPRAS
jgi:hypothetical protein